jgi:hypothetical protein
MYKYYKISSTNPYFCATFTSKYHSACLSLCGCSTFWVNFVFDIKLNDGVDGSLKLGKSSLEHFKEWKDKKGAKNEN